jgi:hypothetical protein
MRQATDRALDRVGELIMARQAPGGGGDLLSSWSTPGCARSRTHPGLPRRRQLTSDDDLAFLSLALSDLRIGTTPGPGWTPSTAPRTSGCGPT